MDKMKEQSDILMFITNVMIMYLTLYNIHDKNEKF